MNWSEAMLDAGPRTPCEIWPGPAQQLDSGLDQDPAPEDSVSLQAYPAPPSLQDPRLQDQALPGLRGQDVWSHSTPPCRGLGARQGWGSRWGLGLALDSQEQ